MSASIIDRLENLLTIYSIPLKEKWPEVDKSEYTVYHYWKALGIINDSELADIFNKQKVIVTSGFINYFRNLDLVFSTKYYSQGNVADVGSGFGFITFWNILSGANKVYSIGDPTRIKFINRLYSAAVEQKIISDNKLITRAEHIKVGDDSLADSIENNSLDLVLLNDTLEHISPRIFPYLVKSSYKNLKKGGYFISRQQNTSSKKMFSELKLYWDNVEKTHHMPLRLKIIQDRVKNINQSDAQTLAINTRGLDSLDFDIAIDNFINESRFPILNPNLPSIDVLTDVPDEGDTNIQRICSEFVKQGFSKIKVYPDLMYSRLSRPLQGLAKILPSVFFKLNLFDKTSVFLMVK
jgi:hypothetical protein